MRPGPEPPVQTGIGSGWACHRDPLFQNQPLPGLAALRCSRSRPALEQEVRIPEYHSTYPG